MVIEELSLTNFRNIGEMLLPLSSTLNFVVGDNGAGKTSILEAVHLLSSGKGLRSGSNSQFISVGESSSIVFAHLIDHKNTHHKLGIQKSRNGDLTVRYDGNNLIRRSDLAGILPLTLITPESHRLVSESAAERRNYLDWSLFHVEHSFIELWRDLNHVLKQRNSLLKSTNLTTAASQLEVWDRQFSDLGEKLLTRRLELLNTLLPFLTKYLGVFLPEYKFTFTIHSGWRGESLYYSLQQSRERDITVNYTTQGPQRGDLVIKANDRLAREVLSRGQQKLLVIALMLSRLELLLSEQSTSGLLLIDDLAAELDINRQRTLLESIIKIGTQTVITSTSLPDYIHLDDDGMKVFHVEHGELVDVI